MENELRIGAEMIRAKMEKGMSREAAIANVWPFLTEAQKDSLSYNDLIAAYHEAAEASNVKEGIRERLKFPKAY